MKTLMALVAGFVLGIATMYFWQAGHASAPAPGSSPLPAAETTSRAASIAERADTVPTPVAAPVAAPAEIGMPADSPTAEAPAAALATTSTEASADPVRPPRSGYGSTAMDEMMRRHQDRKSDWQQPFWNLPREEGDARQAEDKLQYRLFSNPAAQNHPPASMTCRSELCRIEFTFADVEGMQNFHRRWDGSALEGSHSVWSSGLADDDGHTAFIIYAVRNAHFP